MSKDHISATKDAQLQICICKQYDKYIHAMCSVTELFEMITKNKVIEILQPTWPLI